MGIFDQPSRPFWSRSTVLHAVLGLIAYAISAWIFYYYGALWAVSITSLTRLALVRPSSWTLWISTPYPFTLLFLVYGVKDVFLPEALYAALSRPLAFVLVVTAALAVSVPWTMWCISKAIEGHGAGPRRRWAVVVWVLTGAALFSPTPEFASWLLHRVVEPVAMVGYAAIVGHARSSKNVPSMR